MLLVFHEYIFLNLFFSMQLWLLTEGQPESIVQEIEDMVRAYVEKVIC